MRASNMSTVMVQLHDVPSYSNCTVSISGKPSHARGYWGPVTVSEVFQTWQKGALFISSFFYAFVNGPRLLDYLIQGSQTRGPRATCGPRRRYLWPLTHCLKF